MKKNLSGAVLIGIGLFLGTQAIATDPPDCPDCYTLVNLECVWNCLVNEECCNNGCCSEPCCGGGGDCCNSLNCEVCENGSCVSHCDPSQECCNGTCCEPGYICVDGECKAPVCDNCHSLQDTVFECGHTQYDTHCQSDWCIIDVMDTATCDFHPDNTQPSTCTAEAASGPEVMQYKVTSSGCLTGGEPVQFGTWQTQYYGCPSCVEHVHETACETFGCPGAIIDSDPRGVKMACTAACP